MNEHVTDDDLLCGALPLGETTKNDPFIGQCIPHDLAYEKGGGFLTWLKTDAAFHYGIWKKSLTENPLLIPRAALYSVLVGTVGPIMWLRNNL